ncbi:MAG: hypothetical protein AAF202_10670, partial [Pseudomonadota bacterium]
MTCATIGHAVPAAALIPSVGEFFDLLEKKQLKPSAFKPGYKSISKEELQDRLSSKALFAKSKDFESVSSEFIYQGAEIEGQELILFVKDSITETSYRIRLGQKIRMNAAIQKMQSHLGLHAPRAQWLNGAKLRIDSDQLFLLQELWIQHPAKLKWTEFWDSYETGAEGLSLKIGLVEAIDSKSHQPLDWSELPKNEAQLLALFALWLQCADMNSGHNLVADTHSGAILLKGFDRCLGYGLRSGTPNLFAPNVFNVRVRKARPKNTKRYTYNIVARDPSFRRQL